MCLVPLPSFSSREHGCVSFLPPMEKQRVGGGSWPRSRRRAGSCPAPSRGVNGPRNEVSILLSQANVCAPWHETRQSTKEAPKFLELRKAEVRRIPLPRSRVNKSGQASSEARSDYTRRCCRYLRLHWLLLLSVLAQEMLRTVHNDH